MTISARYTTITTIVEMTIQNPTTCLFGEHPTKQWASGHQKVSSRQHLEQQSHQFNSLLCQYNHYILRVGRLILSRMGRMNTSLHNRRPRRSPRNHLNDWIHPQMYIFTCRRIHTKLVSTVLHRKQESRKSGVIVALCSRCDRPHHRHTIQCQDNYFRRSHNRHGTCEAYWY